jgi:hypothetical protein
MAKTTVVKEKKKPVPKKSATEIPPTWYKLYHLLARSGDLILESLILRKDIPEDACKLIKGVLALTDARDLVFAEGKAITPESLEFYTQTLREWAEPKLIPPVLEEEEEWKLN